MRPELTEAFDAQEPLREEWLAYVNTKPLQRLTFEEIEALNPTAREGYRKQRRDAHLTEFTYVTPSTAALQEEMEEIFEDNGGAVENKRVMFLEGMAQEGKSFFLKAFGRRIHRAEINACGEFTDWGIRALRIPVVYVRFRGNPTPLQITRRIALFYGIIGYQSLGFDQLLDAVAIWAKRHGTVLIIVDELSFTQSRGRAGKIMSDHLKSLNNELKVTMIFGGIGLEEKGYLWAGDGPLSERKQMERRSLDFVVEGFDMQQEAMRRGWVQLLNTIESSWYLARRTPLRFSAQFALYLYGRSLGHMGSLMLLINGACNKAMRDGTEVMSKAHLDAVRLSKKTESKRIAGLDFESTAEEVRAWAKTGRLPLRFEERPAMTSPREVIAR